MVDDREELDAAYASGELSKEQYESALAEGEEILAEYCTDIAKTEQLCNEVLAYVNRRITEGEQPFKNGGNV